MEAETLNCPMCGAPAASDATSCEHCGARLATVACPSCFGLIFQGAKFCSHCGAKVDEVKPAVETARECPRCKLPLGAVTIGTASVLECGKCEGLWVDTATFEQIRDDREKQAAVLGMPGSQSAANAYRLEAVHYIPCPVCHTLMNRVNFAHCSHIIVNVCMQHGTWFDKDELRQIVEFIRGGGLEKSRLQEIDELDRKRSLARLDAGGSIGSMSSGVGFSPGPSRYDGYDLAVSVIGAALRMFRK